MRRSDIAMLCLLTIEGDHISDSLMATIDAMVREDLERGKQTAVALDLPPVGDEDMFDAVTGIALWVYCCSLSSTGPSNALVGAEQFVSRLPHPEGGCRLVEDPLSCTDSLMRVSESYLAQYAWELDDFDSGVAQPHMLARSYSRYLKESGKEGSLCEER